MRTTLPPGEFWQKLAEHYQWLSQKPLNELFAEDSHRAERFAIEVGPLYLDYSKNHLTDETVGLLAALAEDNSLREAIDSLYSGAVVNRSEYRAALHTALRGTPAADSEINQVVDQELTRMTALHAKLATGQLTGFSGRPIDTIVNIGIGGSDLGPRLLTEAFADEAGDRLQVHFVANMDPADISRVLRQCDAETTLFIIASKSFTTRETGSNFAVARDWLEQAGCPGNESSRHFLAATANPDAATQAGITPDGIFRFWDWVGGRYSIWSAAGLAAFLAIGPDKFRQFLAGGALVDRHFREAPTAKNLPAMLGLIGVWYINFYGCHSHAVVPDDHRLSLLPPYLAQLVMESTGKSTMTDGKPVGWSTGPVTWGGVGTNSQHSFFQALHQGTHMIPIDFLVSLNSSLDINNQHADLFTSCLAQSRSLMTGAESTVPHRQYPGNRPSNILLYDSLTPEVLGTIVAIYEHKTYVQALLWRINPFDQWGVELGKITTQELSNRLHTGNLSDSNLDSSTRRLLQRYRKRNR
ncbi:MAG: glucose-6-phosphate isomerase [Gammaproteobacteria bacterium]|nr:glucose-6-phosphate isomerase [Gammaproteobacteria bacterium]